MSNVLDEYFPRPKRTPKTVTPPAPDPDGITPPRWFREAMPQPKRKRRDPNKVTAAKLKTIGEGLAAYIFKKAGEKLHKVEQVVGWSGYYKSVDVDFENADQMIKVEAKAWWTKHGENNFPLSRISKKERSYLSRAVAQHKRAYVTIALLDTEPTRGDCNTLYVIPWARWLEIETALRARSAGNYKGRSLRVRDLDLLDNYAIRRKGRRWMLPAGHWLRENQGG